MPPNREEIIFEGVNAEEERFVGTSQSHGNAQSTKTHMRKRLRDRYMCLAEGHFMCFVKLDGQHVQLTRADVDVWVDAWVSPNTGSPNESIQEDESARKSGQPAVSSS